MADRSYCDSKLDESVCELCPQESHHLAHVLRKRVGDEVVLFNGRGREATGEIQTVQRGSVSVRIRNRRDFPPDRSSLVTLATAVPKGERFRWLVEKACELGVDRLVPLRTERSIVHPSEGKMGKMKQTVIAAAKQSGAVFLMQVDEVTPWADLLEPGESARTLLVAHPGGESPARALEQVQPGDSILLAIGPEGGWTDDEMSQAVAAGGRPVGLGSGILRIETAAITLAGFCRLHFLGKS